MESSFSAATWYIGADWQRVIDDFHPPDEPLTVESVAETLPGLLAEMRSRSDVTFKKIGIQLEKEFRRAAGKQAPEVVCASEDGPEVPDVFFWKGECYDGLRKNLFRLLCLLWNSRRRNTGLRANTLTLRVE